MDELIISLDELVLDGPTPPPLDALTTALRERLGPDVAPTVVAAAARGIAGQISSSLSGTAVSER